MTKLKSLDELRAIRDRARENTEMRVTGENEGRTVVSVGMGTCGIAAGARAAMAALMDEIEKNNLENISVVATGCLGHCYAEPLVIVNVPGRPAITYAHVDGQLAQEIVTRHIMRGELIDNAILNREAATHGD